MTRKALLLLVIASLMASGCLTVRYNTDSPSSGAQHEEGANFFLWGLIGEKTVSLDTICPQGVARWYNQATFLNGFLYVITLGIYAPRTIVVECTGGKVYRMRPKTKARLFAATETPAEETER